MRNLSDTLQKGNSFDITNIKFFDGEAVFTASRICVRDGFISEVISENSISEKSQNISEIDGRGKFLMPSLIDYEGHFSTPNDMMLGLVSAKDPNVHARLTKAMSENAIYEIDTHGLNPGHGRAPSKLGSRRNIPNSSNFEKHIRFGVTTVIDQAAFPWPANYVRRARNRWKASDPLDLRKEFLIYADLYTSGMWAAPAGLQFGYYGMDPVYNEWSQDEFQAWVDRRVSESSDHIKIFYDDWGGEPSALKLNFHSLQSLTKAAHARGLKVIVHNGGHRATQELIEAKVDGCIHTPRFLNGAVIDKELATKFAQTVRVVTPTMSVSLSDDNGPFSIANPAVLPGFLNENTAPYLNALDEIRLRGDGWKTKNPDQHLSMFETVARLCEAGALLTLGSDSGTFGPFVEGLTLHHEMFLVHAAIKMFSKMDPTLEALKAGTSSPAKAYGLDVNSTKGEARGFVRPGFRADLLLLNANPFDDIKNTMKIETVFKAGFEANRQPVREL